MDTAFVLVPARKVKVVVGRVANPGGFLLQLSNTDGVVPKPPEPLGRTTPNWTNYCERTLSGPRKFQHHNCDLDNTCLCRRNRWHMWCVHESGGNASRTGTVSTPRTDLRVVFPIFQGSWSLRLIFGLLIPIGILHFTRSIFGVWRHHRLMTCVEGWLQFLRLSRRDKIENNLDYSPQAQQ